MVKVCSCPNIDFYTINRTPLHFTLHTQDLLCYSSTLARKSFTSLEYVYTINKIIFFLFFLLLDAFNQPTPIIWDWSITIVVVDAFKSIFCVIVLVFLINWHMLYTYTYIHTCSYGSFYVSLRVLRVVDNLYMYVSIF